MPDAIVVVLLAICFVTPPVVALLTLIARKQLEIEDPRYNRVMLPWKLCLALAAAWIAGVVGIALMAYIGSGHFGGDSMFFYGLFGFALAALSLGMIADVTLELSKFDY